MTVSVLSPLSFTSYFDPYNGAPLQANLYFYHAGTLDLISVYTDAGLAITHAQPVVTTGSGRVPPVWIPELANGYRVRVFDEFSVLLEDVDNMPSAEPPAGGGGGEPSDPTRLLSTGDVVWNFANSQPRLGFVMCNGGSIGSTASSATQRRNDDTQALFKWLWQQDVDGTILPVSPGGRGASADSDWNANKDIATPDLQGIGVVGVDAMAAVAKNRLAGVPVVSGAGQAKLGSVLGAALHTLTEAQIPAHNHTLTIDPHTHANAKAALHSHPTFNGNTGNQSANHIHSGTTNAENASHQHSYSPPIAAGTVNSGVSFGVATVGNTTITGNDNTNHSHTFSTGNENAAHSHAFSVTIAQNTVQQVVTMDQTTVTATIASAGGGTAHNNTPLAMTLCAYMRL
jgi:microcystin-dependent protein